METENLWECPDCRSIVKNTPNNKSQHRSTVKHLKAVRSKQTSRKGSRRQRAKKSSKVKKVRKRT